MHPIILTVKKWFLTNLGPDGEIWFLVAVSLLALIAAVLVIGIINTAVRRLNDRLMTKDGWRPICWPMAIWAAITWIMLIWASNLRYHSSEHWAVPLFIAAASLLVMVIYHYQILHFLRGTVALSFNLAGGLAITPVVQLGLIAIIAVIVLAIIAFAAPRVVYVEY